MYDFNNKKFLIIHMDDMGLDDAVNAAGMEIFERGIATSASIMVPTPKAQEFAVWGAGNPQYDIGIHITLTAEWDKLRWSSVLPATNVPSLLTEDGSLWQESKSVFDHATLAEYEQETRAQIEKALEWGLKPTHIDSHMGASLASTEWFEIYMNLAIEYNLIPGIPEWILYNHDIDSLCQKKGIPVPKSVKCGRADDYESKKERLINELSEIPYGLNIYTVHPNTDALHLRETLPVWQERYFEYKLLLDDSIKEALTDNNIKLTNWGDVASHTILSKR